MRKLFFIISLQICFYLFAQPTVSNANTTQHYRGVRNKSPVTVQVDFCITSIEIKRMPVGMVIDIWFSAPISPFSISFDECLINFTPASLIAHIKYNTNGNMIRLVIDNKYLPVEYRKGAGNQPNSEYAKIPLCTDTQSNEFITLSIQKVASSTGIELNEQRFERLYPDTVYYFNY